MLALQERGVAAPSPQAAKPAAGRTGAARGAVRPTGAWATGKTMEDVQAAIEAERKKK